MRIGEIAQQTGLNVSNIRFYERKGLLSPKRDDSSNYREYTDEDVLRIKEILLYRKMGVSIETIYLIVNGKADYRDVLARQQDTLKDEIENLNGSLKLCQMILDQDEKDLDECRIDSYLDYVYQEERKGTGFANAAELIEDITEYTSDEILQGYACKFPWIPAALSIALWGVLVAVPVIHIVKVQSGQTGLNIAVLVMWVCMLAFNIYGLIRFHRRKRNYKSDAAASREGDEV